jgi:mono/diheme cytochrome c family protein
MKKIILTAVVLALVGYVAYEALIYYDNEFIYGRMRETPAVRPYEEPLLIMEAGVVPFSGGEMNFRLENPENISSPLNMKDPANIKSGQNVYLTYCAQCHGKNYDGNGPVGQSFYPLPTDLKGAKVQYQKDGYLFHEISYGSPNGRQPALATTVSIAERWQVIAYIKSLGLRK